ncbi:MAG: flippase [Candidatus Pacebacteria bacterium]|nr:flippase [Candidatus Paceibacterota bacterium]
MISSRVVKNTIWLTVGEIVGRLLRITLIFYSARVLGAAEWGVSSYLLSWAVLFTIATDLGLTAIVTRELVRTPERHAEHLSVFFYTKIILLAVAGFVIILVVPKVGALPLSRALMVSLMFLVFFDSIRLIATAVNKAREAMHNEALINIFTQATILVIGIALLMRAPSAEALNVAYAAGSGLGTLYAFFLIRDYLPGIMSSFKRVRVRELLKDSLPIAIVGLVGSLMLNTDIVMLGWMRTAEEIGYYSATQKIIFTLYVLPALIASAAFPAMTRLAHDGLAFKTFFEKILKSSLMMALPVTIGGVITAPRLIELFYGAEYLPATTSYIILLFTVPIAFATAVINNALIAHNSQKHFLAYATIGLTCNVLLNFLLIPLWGINGAALATLVTETITGIFIWRKINRIAGFTVPHGMNTTFAACAVMAVAAYAATLATLPVLAVIAVAIICYAVALYAGREPAFIQLTKKA